MIPVSVLPSLNAILNTTCFFLLVLGFYFIRSRQVNRHRACMISAFSVSLIFMISYLTYHYQVGSVPFQQEGWIRPVYFTILISHIVLAAVVVPLALLTLVRGVRKRFDRHKKIARWTLPIWLYVSVTGVVIYLMLYGL